MVGLSSRNVIIIGAGLIGLGIARKLLQEGNQVCIIDPGLAKHIPTTQASYAAAGMLAPSFEEIDGGVSKELRKATGNFAYGSLRLWHDYAETLIAESGLDIDYRKCGTVGLAYHTDDMAWLAQMRASAHAFGFPIQSLTIAEIDKNISGIETTKVQDAALFLEQGQVDSRLLRQALYAEVKRLGALFEIAEVSTIFSTAEASVQLVLTDGRHIPADQVVVAAGVQARSLWLEEVELPLFAVKGQALSLVLPDTSQEGDTEYLPHVIRTRETYICPKAGRRVLIGASQEIRQNTLHTDDKTINALRAEAVDIMPSLVHWDVQEKWAGLRPTLPDHVPLLDRSRNVSGVFYALAHYRNGVLFLPATINLICNLMQDNQAQSPFGIADRF